MTLNLFSKNKHGLKSYVASKKKKNFYRYQNTDLKIQQNLYTSFNHISKYLRFTHSIDRSVSIYHTKPIDKLLGFFIKKGQKSIAENIFYNVIFILRKRTNLYPLKLIYKALKNVRPVVDVKIIKKSGRKLELPKILGVSRRFYLAMKWLIKSSETHQEYNTFDKKFLLEILNSIKLKSGSSTLKKSLMSRVIKSRINQRYKYFDERKKFKLFNLLKSSKIQKLPNKAKLTKLSIMSPNESVKNIKPSENIRYIVDVKKSLSAVRGSIRKNFI